jgi:transcription initiation factor IIF auxiliary subunit
MKEDIEAGSIKLTEDDLSFLSGLASKYPIEPIANAHKKNEDKVNEYNFKEEKID